MIIQLTGSGTVVTDADDCTRLHVHTSLPPGDIDEALRTTGTGRLTDDGVALLDLGPLRTRARAAATVDDWDDRWQNMIAHGERKGWIPADGATVQAHVETTAPVPG